MMPADKPGPSFIWKLGRGLGILGFSLLIFLLWVWTVLAIYYSNLSGGTLRTVAAALFGIVFAVAFVVGPNRRRTALWFSAAFLVVLVWFWLIPPSHDRDWEPSVAVLPRAKARDGKVTVYNVRDFDYRTPDDFTIRYYNKTFDLKELDSVDFVVSYWNGNVGIAHTLISFGFGGKDYLTLSVELRREKGENYSGLGGLFKQYELIYILGDERDLIRLRANFRKEEVYLYPTRATREQARELFLTSIARVNQIYERPEFYNTIIQNCSTSLAPQIERLNLQSGIDKWRLLLNGYSDEMAYYNGWIDSNLSFAETKARHYINQYVRNDPDTSDFSRKIRPHLNGR